MPHKLETRDGRDYVGRCWFGRRDGLAVLFLTGTPYEMGYANGLLTRKLITRQEDSILELLNRYAPQKPVQFLLKFVLVFKNRNLPKHIIPEHQLEILGLSDGCPDAHPETGPYYHRLLNYHGAQDISYMLMNSPLLHRACTSFGAWGPRTREQHLLTGRNFDWEAHPVFDEDRILIYCEPEEGIPFISLAWAGMAGCVSGMNREGLSVCVNGAPSRLPRDVGTPTCLIAREVLQHARTIDEAKEIIAKRKVFVSALFLVGSRNDGRFVVFEKTPDKTVLRESGPDPLMLCANHYLTPELQDDPINLQYQRVDTSISRFDRLRELVGAGQQTLDPEQCVSVLRDRRLPGGLFAGNGHRGSLNPLIATHAVVMDLTTGTFWASIAPHQLGRFVAFDVKDIEKPIPGLVLPEDTMLASGEFKRFLDSQRELDAGWKALQARAYQSAAASARAAETNNPGFYRNSWLLAEALSHLGDEAGAIAACERALAGKPAYESERRKLELLRESITGRLKAGATKPGPKPQESGMRLQPVGAMPKTL
jgi:hypothetical protein